MFEKTENKLKEAGVDQFKKNIIIDNHRLIGTDWNRSKQLFSGAVVAAKLVEGLLPMSEVCGSNPVISKIYIEQLLTVLKRRKRQMSPGKVYLIFCRPKMKIMQNDAY